MLLQTPFFPLPLSKVYAATPGAHRSQPVKQGGQAKGWAINLTQNLGSQVATALAL